MACAPLTPVRLTRSESVSKTCTRLVIFQKLDMAGNCVWPLSIAVFAVLDMTSGSPHPNHSRLQQGLLRHSEPRGTGLADWSTWMSVIFFFFYTTVPSSRFLKLLIPKLAFCTGIVVLHSHHRNSLRSFFAHKGGRIALRRRVMLHLINKVMGSITIRTSE